MFWFSFSSALLLKICIALSRIGIFSRDTVLLQQSDLRDKSYEVSTLSHVYSDYSKCLQDGPRLLIFCDNSIHNILLVANNITISDN